MSPNPKSSPNSNLNPNPHPKPHPKPNSNPNPNSHSNPNPQPQLQPQPPTPTRAEDIDHIEVSRECALEAACLRRLAELHVQRQELQARRSSSRVDGSASDPEGPMTNLRPGRENSIVAAPDGPGRTGSTVAAADGAKRPRALVRGAWTQLKRTLHVNTHVNTASTFLVGPKGVSAEEADAPGACARAWRAFRLRRQRRRETLLEESIRRGERQIQRLLLAEHRTTGHAFVVFKQEEKRAELVAHFYRPPLFEAHMARLLRREPRKRGSGRLERAVANVGDCTVHAAPEPGDVYWENLAVSKRSHRLWQTVNVVVVVLVVLLSLAVLTAVSTIRAIVTMNESPDRVVSWRVFLLSLVGAGVSVGTNNLLEGMCNAMSRLEQPSTRTGYERAVFSKLAPAFVINTAIAPLVVGCVEAGRSGVFNGDGDGAVIANVAASVFGQSAAGGLSDQKLVNQWFFETGGIVQHVLLTILASVGTDVAMLVQPRTLLRRYLLAPFAHSQHKLNRLWRPPPMLLGTLYAYALRTTSVALIWAPLNPLVLPLAAAMLGVSFWSLRFAVAFWYEKPSAMTEAIVERLRVYIGWTVPVGLLLRKLTYSERQALTPFLVAVALWATYLLVDFVGHYSFGAAYNQLGQQASGKSFDPLNMEGRAFPYSRVHAPCAHVLPQARLPPHYSSSTCA